MCDFIYRFVKYLYVLYVVKCYSVQCIIIWWFGYGGQNKHTQKIFIINVVVGVRYGFYYFELPFVLNFIFI